MSHKGKKLILADIKTVWDGLNDPEMLLRVMPGCKSVSGSVEEGFDVVVSKKVGAINLTFKGRVVLSNLVEYKSYTITGGGKSGRVGSVQGTSDIRLKSVKHGTMLHYNVTTGVSGKIVTLLKGLIEPATAKVIERFLSNLKNHLETPESRARLAEHRRNQAETRRRKRKAAKARTERKLNSN